MRVPPVLRPGGQFGAGTRIVADHIDDACALGVACLRGDARHGVGGVHAALHGARKAQIGWGGHGDALVGKRREIRHTVEQGHLDHLHRGLRDGHAMHVHEVVGGAGEYARRHDGVELRGSLRAGKGAPREEGAVDAAVFIHDVVAEARGQLGAGALVFFQHEVPYLVEVDARRAERAQLAHQLAFTRAEAARDHNRIHVRVHAAYLQGSSQGSSSSMRPHASM